VKPRSKSEKPGNHPFTRGIHPGMYRDRLWTMRQYTGFGTADQTNQRFKYLLERGQTGLSMAFDLPTQIGYDADDPHAEGEVGKVGVSITSLKDMMTCFNGIPLDKVSTSMTINSTASTLLSLYIATGESQGVKSGQLRGTTQNDILKEYIARNTYIYPPRPSMRLIGDMIEYCSKKVPQWYPISISGYHMREAGCNAIQEVAFTLANAIEYIQTCIERGLNIVRVAIQSMAAVLGGCQSLHTNSKDEALALPTEAAVKIALRTQQVVGHESGITKTADPMAGSYYVEYLTDTIEDEVNKYLKK